MKDKSGFTLMELLVVILLLSILAVIVVPNIMSNISSSKKNLSKIEMNNLKTSVSLYLQDYCINPLGDKICPFATTTDTKGSIIVGTSDSPVTMSLSGFLDKDYLNTIGRLERCSGNILIINNNVDLSNIVCANS